MVVKVEVVVVVVVLLVMMMVVVVMVCGMWCMVDDTIGLFLV